MKAMTGKIASIAELNERSRTILRRIVDTYMETGEPVGSRTVSQQMDSLLSPASVRNVMADLEQVGLLASPHTSAGRIPTELGLRLFVNGLLEIGRLDDTERQVIDAQCHRTGKSLDMLLQEASSTLSGLSGCAGLVLAPKTEATLKHIEFVYLGPGRALVVIVTEDGIVENRAIDLPPGIVPSALEEATNFLNAHSAGRSVQDVRQRIARELEQSRAELDQSAEKVIQEGLAMWAGDSRDQLIIRGQASLLKDVKAVSELERVKGLFEMLETRKQLVRLLDLTNQADGVQIFIGADNDLFDLSGCSMISAPYRNSKEQIIGAIGVIGPSRMNYAHIIPLVDYTAKVLGRLIG